MKLWNVEVLDFGNANETHITVGVDKEDAIQKVLDKLDNQGYFATAKEIDIVDGFKVKLVKK